MSRKIANLLENELIGQRFGKLVILSLEYVKRGSHNRLSAHCKCDCNKVKMVFVCGLKIKGKKATKSCGCSRIGSCNHKFKDLMGIKFGRLLVIEYNGRRISKSGRSITQWLCSCECGNRTIVGTSKLTTGETKSCGCINKDKGELHYNWNPNILKEDRENKRGCVKNIAYENWRKSVYERDNYTCQLTGKRGKITAHHIFSWNKYPELRYDIDNGITLSDEMHREFHKLYGRGDNTRDQFDAFVAAKTECK